MIAVTLPAVVVIVLVIVLVIILVIVHRRNRQHSSSTDQNLTDYPARTDQPFIEESEVNIDAHRDQPGGPTDAPTMVSKFNPVTIAHVPHAHRILSARG